MHHLLSVLFLLMGAGVAAAPLPPDDTKKEVGAQRVTEAPVIDGQLDEPAWQYAVPTQGFTTLDPTPGKPASQEAEIRIIYDNDALYIGAYLYDTQPDSIMQELSERDVLRNTDWFGIFIDAYRDGINGFGFILSPAEVQYDAKYSTFGEDDGWDAVWEGRTSRTDRGWIAEIRIPYAALRFPDIPEQKWHINFGRRIARNGEKSFWSPINPQVSGLLNQSGYLTGLRDLKPPIRLQATPFLAIYGQHHHDVNENPIDSYGRSITGGMDVKVGLSEAFTLDMTLIPDFGEAQSDNQVLNLSPFEVRFDENRAFFTEGTELFNKGGLFYSRRIGGQPFYRDRLEEQYEEENILSNPAQSQLINATKISGRTAKGTGIGFFNATSARTYARVRDPELGEMDVLTDPLTNYSVFVVDQNLPHNSYATLINTTVLREGSAYDANVTGTDFLLRNRANSYAIGGQAVVSQQYFPDSTGLGHMAEIRLRKTSGNLAAGLTYSEESDTYDPNDLGFLFQNNSRELSGFVEYNQYESFGPFNRGSIGLYTEYSRVYNPSHFTNWGFNIWAWLQTKKFWNFELGTYVEPTETFDFFEARRPGRMWRNPGGTFLRAEVSTDRRKRLRLEVSGDTWISREKGRYNYELQLESRYRVSDRLNFNLDIGREYGRHSIGYVTELDNETADIIFGRRNRTTIETTFRTNYTFNANMALSFRLRHYWSKVVYNAFHLLDDEGYLGDTDYHENNDGDFDAFNIDLVYRWRFAPGSDIFVVWKNSISNFQELPSADYWRNLNGLFREPQDNSISIKIIYFLDYASLVRK
ncbi:MAG: carbohydrate binding family 9 domain-containing protein [Lewinella sp.]|nr:carbohydrate binding family 9 domain-containing protein [Lewinella sp.]